MRSIFNTKNIILNNKLEKLTYIMKLILKNRYCFEFVQFNPYPLHLLKCALRPALELKPVVQI